MWKHKLCLGVSASFGLPVEEQIPLLGKIGFDAFFTGWKPGAPIDEWRKLADNNGLEYQSLHAPFNKMDVIWKEGDEGRAAARELCGCLGVCAANEIPIMVAHAFIGFKDHTPTEAGIENFSLVAEEARRLGVKLALENTEGEEYLAALLNAFCDNEAVGFCWDSGHELCYNHGKDLLAVWGERLIATHLNDNLGISRADGDIFWTDDLHLLPFDGIRDWQEAARRLNACGYDGILTFELTRQSKPGRHDNDKYAALPPEQYLAEAYARACRFAWMRENQA